MSPQATPLNVLPLDTQSRSTLEAFHSCPLLSKQDRVMLSLDSLFAFWQLHC